MKLRSFILVLIVAMIVTALATYYYTKSAIAAKAIEIREQPIAGVVKPKGVPMDCDFTVFHEKTFKFIQPILFAENYCESEQLAGLKKNLQDKVASLEARKAITRSSVYFKELNSNRWTEINGQNKYYPGSMLKLAVMMNILKLAEPNPGLLSKKMTLKKRTELVVVVPSTNPLKVGEQYSVTELLEAMIVRSDNDAASLLMELIDQRVYVVLFGDLGIEVPAMDDWYYSLTASEFGKIYRVLYNSSFLIRPYSEYAMSLLSRSEYTNGLLRYLPPKTAVAHKFGERFTETNLKQFHESGIVYQGELSYLIVVMNEGENLDSLQNAVASLSKFCYDFVTQAKN